MTLRDRREAPPDDLDVDRGCRTLRVVRKGGKPATIPLPPRPCLRSTPTIGSRTAGPIFVGVIGARMDRYCLDRHPWVDRYHHSLPDQNIDLTGVAAGVY